MLNVPPRYTEGYFLLYSTLTGADLLEDADLSNAFGVETKGLRAYGRATSATKLELTDATLPAANQACLLAHELTHCLDLAFWRETPETISPAMRGATEINAHYNQGLIARELVGLNKMAKSWSQEVHAMNANNTTFGYMANALERTTVFERLHQPGGEYQASAESLRRDHVIYFLTRDDQWEDICKKYHCEKHLFKNCGIKLERPPKAS